MSTLTRVAVIMLVVFSLLQTAAIVVFVNQVGDYKKSMDTQKALLTAATDAKNAATASADAARASAQESISQATAQVEEAKRAMNSLQQDSIKKDVDLSKQASDLAIQAADRTRLAEALKASEDTKSHLSDQVVELRTGNDKFVMQNAQLNQTVTDLTNKLEVMTREFKFVSEQLAEFKGQVEKQQAMMRDAGISSQQLASASVNGAATPAINGVVRAVKPIGGIPYATISVGSADGVAKGMEFKVVNRQTGDFLGVLTVDSVELNEATGRLSGPRVNDIRPPLADVKTQL